MFFRPLSRIIEEDLRGYYNEPKCAFWSRNLVVFFSPCLVAFLSHYSILFSQSSVLFFYQSATTRLKKTVFCRQPYSDR